MAHISDLKAAALSLEGYRGALPDQLQAWLLFELPDNPAEQINDLWEALFDRDGIAQGQYNDRYFQWLAQQGHTEPAYPDRNFSYWLARFGRAIVAYANSLTEPPHAE